MDESTKELQQELQWQVSRSRRRARLNCLAGYLNAILSIGTSICAAVLVAANANKTLTVTFAALPAALMAVGGTFRFEQKSAWHWRKNKLLAGLLRSLKYEGADPAKVSETFSKIELELDQGWIALGGGDKNNRH